MSTDSGLPNDSNIDRAADDFAQLILKDADALEQMRQAIFGVAQVVNDRVSPTPQLAGNDVVPFLQKLRTCLDGQRFEGDGGDGGFDSPIVFIIFGKGPKKPPDPDPGN